MTCTDWLADKLESAARKLRKSTRGAPMGPWTEHWERVRVGYERVCAVYGVKSQPYGTAEAFYDVIAFFVFCHHFREWCSRDKTAPSAARKFARKTRTPELKACADIANRAKHCTLTRTASGDLNAGPSGNDVAIHVGTGTSHKFRFRVGSCEYDALALAQLCVAQWGGVLT